MPERPHFWRTQASTHTHTYAHTHRQRQALLQEDDGEEEGAQHGLARATHTLRNALQKDWSQHVSMQLVCGVWSVCIRVCVRWLSFLHQPLSASQLHCLQASCYRASHTHTHTYTHTNIHTQTYAHTREHEYIPIQVATAATFAGFAVTSVVCEGPLVVASDFMASVTLFTLQRQVGGCEACRPEWLHG